MGRRPVLKKQPGEISPNAATGTPARDVLAFIKHIDKQVPRGLDIHVVLDNPSAYTAPEVPTWVEHPRRARWHLHFTPTSSSWLNPDEMWLRGGAKS